MNEKTAFNLIQQYIEGWKQNDLLLILSTLAEDCVVIESHGPQYQGIREIERWFGFWLNANGKVTKWDLLSLYFCEKKKRLSSNGLLVVFPMVGNIPFPAASVWLSFQIRK